MTDKPHRDARLVELYQEGYSMRQVAARLDISLERVRQILTREGIPRRPMHITRHHRKYTGLKAV